LEKVEEFNKDPCIDGILVQLPLPVHLDTCKIISSILPSKDVDGLHPCNVGSLSMRHRIPHLVPCTAKGIIEMLDDQKVEIEGKTAVVIGRSDLVGNPVSMLLRKRNATVIHCHSKTSNLSSYVKQADILVAACGHPYLVRGSWIKPGSTVIDVGINFIPDWREESGYRIVGDVCFDEALNVAGSITPVPGGVGPMTIAMLLHNVVAAFKYHIVASHENI
jgi:5,10-methylene-tetrahydrofolate dehydrogenase/methenyl tetrahydrofolate cyclohydrolase